MPSPHPRPSWLAGPAARPATAVALAVTALLLAACSGGDDDVAPSPEPSAESGTDSSTLTPVPEVTPAQELPDPAAYQDTPALRDLVLVTGYDATDAGWAATGTAANPGTETATYGVLVYFTDSYSRGVAASEIEIEVGPGETVDWTAAQDVWGEDGTLCVLRAVEPR